MFSEFSALQLPSQVYLTLECLIGEIPTKSFWIILLDLNPEVPFFRDRVPDCYSIHATGEVH